MKIAELMKFHDLYLLQMRADLASIFSISHIESHAFLLWPKFPTLKVKENRSKKREVMNKKQLTTTSGRPVGDNQNSLTVGPRGPVVFEDFLLFEKMAHFN